MDITQLKHVVGEVSKDKPAIIRFFDSVNQCSAEAFNNEFLWLQECVKPSKIVVLINSEGGSVLYGMSIFSVIQSCPIPVDCVVEGIAASMGSVIWAAGNNSYMHDYSILMIHNPFNTKGDLTSEMQATVEAFRGQLEMIYRKRFGLSKEKVAEIMDGGEGVDGTYFSAKDAVKAGILSKDNIIKTSKQLCDKVKAEISVIGDVSAMREKMTEISASVDQNKLPHNDNPINNQNKLHEVNKTMEENKIAFGAIAAQLGFQENQPVANVSARVAVLLAAEAKLAGVESKLTEVQAQHTELQIKYQGKETEVQNLTQTVGEQKLELEQFHAAAKQAKDAEILALVNAAITAGKINEEAKATWVQMAHNNLDLTKATLESIPAREKITEKIAQDPANVNAAKEGLTAAEKEVQAKVEAVVGKDFELKTFGQ